MNARLRHGLAAAALALCIATPAWAGQPVYAVGGAITAEQGAPVAIAAEDFAKIGITEIKTKVLTMGDGEHSVKGVLARDLIKYVGGKGTTLKLTALDGYQIDVPVADVETYDVVVATEIDGKVLSVRDKGPAWLIYPVSGHKELDDTVYESRSVWQIKQIDIN